MSKYTMLIVDDELLAMEYLASFPCVAELEFETVGRAVNGKLGFEAYLRLNPDLIISDVKMPVEDGISMARKIVEHCELCGKRLPQIYLLTAYSDFDYVKSAFDLGISGYILKHEISNEKMRQLLQKAVDRREEQDAVLSLERQIIVKDLIVMDQPEVLKKNGSLFKNRYYLPVIIHKCLSFNLLMGEFHSSVASGLYGYIRENISTLSKSFDDIICTDLDNMSYILLIGVESKSSLYVLQQYLQRVYAQFKNIANEGNRMGTVLYSLKSWEISELPKFYKKYCQNSRKLFFYQHLGVVSLDEISADRAEPVLAEAELARLSQCFQNGDAEGGARQAEQLLELLTDSCKDCALFAEQVKKLTRLITEQYGRLQTGLPCAGQPFSLACGAEATTTVEIREGFSRMLALLKGDTDCRRYSAKVNTAIQYIHENYGNDISLDQLARLQGISSVYLSRLFKKETGINLVEYLTQYRVEKSKELLNTTKLKIFQIADMVGYQSSQYFSSIFKKYGGLSPYEYRERPR